ASRPTNSRSVPGSVEREPGAPALAAMPSTSVAHPRDTRPSLSNAALGVIFAVMVPSQSDVDNSQCAQGPREHQRLPHNRSGTELIYQHHAAPDDHPQAAAHPNQNDRSHGGRAAPHP